MSEAGRRSQLLLIAVSLLPVIVVVIGTSHVIHVHQNTAREAIHLGEDAARNDRLLLALRVLGRQPAEALTTETATARRTLGSADRAFRSTLAGIRSEVARDARSERSIAALQQLSIAGVAAARITAGGERIIDATAGGDRKRAGELLVEINDAYDVANLAIIDRRRAIEAANVEMLEAEKTVEEQWASYETILLAASFLLIAGLSVYWRRRLLEQVEQRERERAIEAMQLRNFAFEQAMDGVATFDSQRRITWANGSFARIVGYEADELPGTDIRSSIHELDSRVLAELAEELRATGRSERVLRVMRKDGSTVHVHAVLVNLQSGDGGFIFLQDVTKQQQVEAALRLTEERFGMAMLATRDLISDWDILQNKSWVNDALHTEYGYPPDWEASVEGWIDSIHPDDREEMLARINAAFAEPIDSWTGEYRLRRHDGTYAYVVDRSYLVRNEEGLPVRLVSALTDMSARRHAEQELERISAQNRLILSAAADGIVGLDIDGRTTFVNPAAVELLGFSADELAENRLHEAVAARAGTGEALAWTGCPIHQSLESGLASHGNAIYTKKDGSPIHVEYSSVPMFDGHEGIVGAVLTFRDVTGRLAIERMKAEFISVVSHELRTPLTSIRGALGLIAGGRVGEVPARIGRMLEIAVSNTDRLIRLINDILDNERIDSGKIALSRELCDAAALIDEAVDAMTPLAEQAGVRLVHDAAAGALFADHDRVLQTLTNLIGNAIKFSPGDTTVTISAVVEGGEVRFAVTDAGRGIPLEKLESIFERFQQVDATDSRQKGGSGLGLAISRSIVRQHGGAIHAESDGHSWSRFVFTLPQVQFDARALGVPHRQTVLICEDDPVILEIESELLEQAGYCVAGFGSGDALLESSRLSSAEAIILDIGLPDIPGDEVAARLASLRETSHIPVIILSGSVQREIGGNVVASLMKPLSADELLSAVAKAIDPPHRRPRVLLIEDDIDLAGVLRESFARLGAVCRHAVTGREAIEIAGTLTPELIVLDLSLPEIDGFGVIDYFKDHGLMTDVPLVVYSSHEPTPSERDRLRLGPTQFLTKSRVTPEEFEQHMSRLLDPLATDTTELSRVA